MRSRGAAGARGLDGLMRALSTWRGLRSVCGIALLSQRFDFGLRPALRFCCSVFFSAYARLCVSGAASCLRSRLLFVLRQTGRLAMPCVSIPPGRDRRLCVLAALRDAGAGWPDEGAFHAARFAFSVRHCASVGAFALGLRPALRFCCSVFSRHMPGSAVLSARLALGLRPALRF